MLAVVTISPKMPINPIAIVLTRMSVPQFLAMNSILQIDRDLRLEPEWPGIEASIHERGGAVNMASQAESRSTESWLPANTATRPVSIASTAFNSPDRRRSKVVDAIRKVTVDGLAADVPIPVARGRPGDAKTCQLRPPGPVISNPNVSALCPSGFGRGIGDPFGDGGDDGDATASEGARNAGGGATSTGGESVSVSGDTSESRAAHASK